MLAEVVEVRRDWKRCAADSEAADDVRTGGGGCDAGSVRYESVVVGFLNPLVDNSSGPGIGHFRAKNGRLIRESSRLWSIAACLGEEDWDVVLAGILLQLGVAALRKSLVWDKGEKLGCLTVEYVDSPHHSYAFKLKKSSALELLSPHAM